MTGHSPAVHRAIVVVDVERFTGRPENQQSAIRQALYDILPGAFEESNVPWNGCKHEDRGDGLMILVHPDVPKVLLVDQLPQRIVAALRRYNATRVESARIRLRLALNAGEVRLDDHGVSGDAVNLAFRLVDAQELRRSLADSSGVLAMITSDRCYRDVVLSDPGVDKSAYHRVDINVKQTAAVAWICVPDDAIARAAPLVTERSVEPYGPEVDIADHRIGGGVVLPEHDALFGLMDALFGIPTMQDAGGRRMCVDLLRTRFGSSFVVLDQPIFRHISAIVAACLDRSGGLDALVEVLTRMGNDAASVLRLRAAVDGLSALDLVSANHREQLFTLLAAGNWPDATEIYRFVGGSYAPDPRGANNDPRQLFTMLEHMNAPPHGVSPALSYVQRLAMSAEPGLAEQLERWLRERCAEMEIGEPKPVLDTSALPPGVADEAYLIFRLLRHELDGECFLLRSWRQRGTSWRPEPGEEVVGTIAEIEAYVAKLAMEAEVDWAADAEIIRLEFLLPLELLSLPADRWRRAAGGNLPQPLGIRYQIAVRSLDRMRAVEWHRDWRRRWRAMNKLLSGAEPQADWLLRVAPVTSSSPSQLRKLDAELAVRDDVVSLVFDPPIAHEGGIADAVTLGLRAGIPLMLWQRGDTLMDNFEDTADALLGPGLGSVRETARIVRGRAFGADDPEFDAGSHMTVLWDDPDRLVEPEVRPAAPG